MCGDFNAHHTSWNCKRINATGNAIYKYSHCKHLEILAPPTPTRYGPNSATTIDLALTKNFAYRYKIESIPDLASDHNPVILNFDFKIVPLIVERQKVSTNWDNFKNHLNESFNDFDIGQEIVNTNDEMSVIDSSNVSISDSKKVPLNDNYMDHNSAYVRPSKRHTAIISVKHNLNDSVSENAYDNLSVDDNEVEQGVIIPIKRPLQQC
ncbi:hypothetical protein AVEN_22756-1 [Araneus ventricosus]|uniref:Endonuclease/exonuclease/phosphatase domain-containing protein n=1 Tax=Araneus ventricosus TaxID=182803 RepID=A0A4Y2MGR1_ARAVE|nr:hypothetical protein AVEN_22756-1 [Araneus ventricosus]